MRCENTKPFLMAILAVVGLTSSAQAYRSKSTGDCEPSWIPTFGGMPGVNHVLGTLAAVDDGSGDGLALYAGGLFTAAGGVLANHIAKWDGTSWAALGDGIHGAVWALAEFDDGSGPALYAGGGFGFAGGVLARNIARWDGTCWSPLGSGVDGTVWALAVFDDGSGPALYAGGDFSTAGGVAANSIAKWNGENWSALGSGVDGTVQALTVFDDGSGPTLCAGGDFRTAGLVQADLIAKWNGANWARLGHGLGGNPFPCVYALAVFDDGGGPALYAGGDIQFAGGDPVRGIAKWDGADWSPLGNGVGAIPAGTVRALTTFDDGDGGGQDLYVGGSFSMAGQELVYGFARWDGAAWSAVEGAGGHTSLKALAVFDDGDGPALYGAKGADVEGMAKWNGSDWSPVGRGLPAGVSALAVFDDGLGRGPALYVAGLSRGAGEVEFGGVARWDGTTWSPLQPGRWDPAYVVALAVHDAGDGGGRALYAGGHFQSAGGVGARKVARWNGTDWSPVAGGFDDSVLAFEVFDDGAGPALYAAGVFARAGGIPANRVARLDESTWLPLGVGLNNEVYALATFDDGNGDGPALYAGGRFTTAGGIAANAIARWDGMHWSPVGGGIGPPWSVSSLEVFDDGRGGGPELYAGGNFFSAGGVEALGLAKWNGDRWSSVGSGVSPPEVCALAVSDVGGRPALYVGGPFTTAGGVSAKGIARWDGVRWAPLGGGLNGAFGPNVSTITDFDDGTGLALFAGGSFSSAVDSGDSFLAKWGCGPDRPPETYCAGKRSSVGCVPFLSSNGLPSASATDAFDVTAEDVVPSEAGVLLYGFAESALSFHGGTLCVKAPLVRTSGTTSEQLPGGGCSNWILRRDFNKTVQSGSDPRLTTGQTVFAQWRQRDPADPRGFGDSLTNGLRFTIGP